MVGERWAMLIVRDLLVGPRRFSDLHRGLPGIPTNILSARLKELEQADIVRRRLLPRPAGSVVYELTGYGHDLEPAMLALGRWGAKSLGDVRPGETVTPDSLVVALRATFRPEAARGLDVGYELHVGPIVLGARIHGGNLEVAEGPLPDADLVIEAGLAIKGLLSGELSVAEAVESGAVALAGDVALLERFVDLFQIAPKPGVPDPRLRGRPEASPTPPGSGGN